MYCQQPEHEQQAGAGPDRQDFQDAQGFGQNPDRDRQQRETHQRAGHPKDHADEGRDCHERSVGARPGEAAAMRDGIGARRIVCYSASG